MCVCVNVTCFRDLYGGRYWFEGGENACSWGRKEVVVLFPTLRSRSEEWRRRQTGVESFAVFEWVEANHRALFKHESCLRQHNSPQRKLPFQGTRTLWRRQSKAASWSRLLFGYFLEYRRPLFFTSCSISRLGHPDMSLFLNRGLKSDLGRGIDIEYAIAWRHRNQ